MESKTKQQSILIFFLTAACVLIVKSAQIQVFDRSFADKARRVTLDKDEVYPSRGLITDRNESFLVVNEPVYELKAIFNKVDVNMDTAFFCELLEISKESFIENLNKDWRSARFDKHIPFIFLSKIKPEIYGQFQEHIHMFPGFYPVYRKIRTYPQENAAHLLGYLGEVNENELRNDEENLYTLGDFIGKKGIEKFYEKTLKGEKGVKYLIKDALGREVNSFEDGRLDSSAIAGMDLQLTVDIDLQKYAEDLLQNKRGSIVAIKPSNGEILTMASAPSYDPSVFELNDERGERYQQLASDTLNKPFLDRSINAKYPPGSIFKPILSLIALQEGTTYPGRTIYCDGYYQYRGFKYGCHAHPVPYNMTIALEHSCNAYYFQIVRDLLEINGFSKPGEGLDILNNHLKDFGLGQRLGIDMPGENGGFIPTTDYYNRSYANEISGWKSTYVMSIGIGQGELELTTLQMANLASILANQGSYYLPHLIKSIDGSEIDNRYLIEKNVRIDNQHFKPVLDGMERAINSGTGGLAGVSGIRVCGKTGTSQNPHGKDHSVFFAFAPRENPEIAIAVYVENAGFGGNIAAPIAGLMIEKYLKGEIGSTFKKQVEQNLMSKVLIEQ